MALTIEQIKLRNADAGKFFFSPDTLRFFSSRVSGTVYSAGKDRGQFFVTSERYNDSSPRMYTIRRFDQGTGDVSTAEGHCFQEYASSTGAQAAAYRAAKAEGDLNDQEWAIIYGKEN